jgi:hypothetical protein
VGKEQTTQDPVSLARAEFIQEMVASYDSQRILSRLLSLQNALLSSGTPPVDAFAELKNAAHKAVSQAASKKDDKGSEQFGELEKGYTLTLQSFTRPSTPEKKKQKPTPTSGKQMSEAKL